MPEEFGKKDWRRFAAPAFIEKLWEHLIERLGAQPETILERHEQPRGVNPLVRSAVVISMWARFRPVFERLVWLRDIIGIDLQRWHHLRRLAEASADQIAGTYLKLLVDGDYANRIALEHLLAALESRFEIAGPSDTKRPPIPWHCWAAMAALQSLTSGIVPTVPTRKQVIDGAIEFRAAFELMDDFADPVARASKIAELKRVQSSNWARVIRELDLVGLPLKEQRL